MYVKPRSISRGVWCGYFRWLWGDRLPGCEASQSLKLLIYIINGNCNIWRDTVDSWGLHCVSASARSALVHCFPKQESSLFHSFSHPMRVFLQLPLTTFQVLYFYVNFFSFLYYFASVGFHKGCWSTCVMPQPIVSQWKLGGLDLHSEWLA